jgi:hypothetical protein
MPEQPTKPEAQQVPRKSFSEFQEYRRIPSLIMLIRELKLFLKDCSSVLDIGCGDLSPMRFVPCAKLIGVDGYEPALNGARKLGTHDEYYLSDVTKVGELFPNRRFDACVSLDVIEHLHKPQGWSLLEQMEKLATKRVIILTPNGFLPQKSHDGDLQEHVSGWTPEEFRARGYQVYGMYGPKSYRGEHHRITKSPVPFWLLASILMQFTRTRGNPAEASAIFCVKELSGK